MSRYGARHQQSILHGDPIYSPFEVFFVENSLLPRQHGHKNYLSEGATTLTILSNENDVAAPSLESMIMFKKRGGPWLLAAIFSVRGQGGTQSPTWNAIPTPSPEQERNFRGAEVHSVVPATADAETAVSTLQWTGAPPEPDEDVPTFFLETTASPRDEQDEHLAIKGNSRYYFQEERRSQTFFSNIGWSVCYHGEQCSRSSCLL